MTQVVTVVEHVGRINEQATRFNVGEISRNRLLLGVGGVAEVTFTDVVGTNQGVELSIKLGAACTTVVENSIDFGSKSGFRKRC